MLKFILLSLLFSSFAGAQTLGEIASQRTKTFTEKMPKEVVELYQDNIKELKTSGLEKKALKVGDKVPDVMVNVGGKVQPLSSVYANGPVVLKFYRGGWCGYCMAELKYYENMADEFKAAGAKVLPISPDTIEVSAKTKATNSLSFDMTSDKNHEAARKFGLVYTLDSKVAQSLKKNGVDLSNFQDNDKNELAIPATYVVGKDGKIAFSFVDADYRVRAEPSVVLQAVKAMNKKN